MHKNNPAKRTVLRETYIYFAKPDFFSVLLRGVKEYLQEVNFKPAV